MTGDVFSDAVGVLVHFLGIGLAVGLLTALIN